MLFLCQFSDAFSSVPPHCRGYSLNGLSVDVPFGGLAAFVPGFVSSVVFGTQYVLGCVPCLYRPFSRWPVGFFALFRVISVGIPLTLSMFFGFRSLVFPGFRNPGVLGIAPSWVRFYCDAFRVIGERVVPMRLSVAGL